MENYPGWDSQHRSFFDVSLYMVECGIKQFYKLEGRWPSSWLEVRQRGIFQVNLVDFEGRIIDPDDGVCDRIGDVTYRLSNDGTKGIVTSFDGKGRPRFGTFDHTRTPSTYAAVCRASDKVHRTTWFTDQLDDRTKMRTFALMGMIRKSIRLYKMVHGHYPATWEEFVNSGIAPVDAGSINPHTLAPIDGQRGPKKIRYQYVPKQPGKESDAFAIYLCDDSGRQERYGFRP